MSTFQLPAHTKNIIFLLFLLRTHTKLGQLKLIFFSLLSKRESLIIAKKQRYFYPLKTFKDERSKKYERPNEILVI